MERKDVDRQIHDFLHLRKDVMRRFFQNCGLFNGHPFHLFYIHTHPGVTQHELSEQLNVSPATVAVSIRRLESAGLVERVRDDRDKRLSRLYLTEAGVAMDDRCLQGRDFLIDTLYRNFTEEELNTLSGLVRKMTDNLEQAGNSLPEQSEEKEMTE